MSEIKVGMIGGAGQMGRLLQRLLPMQLEIASSREENRELVQNVDVVIIGVPVEKTLEVIAEVAPLMREEQLLLDITSLKIASCEAMLKSKASVIGMHPLFGPSTQELEGNHLVICPVRPGKWKDRVKGWFKELDIIETTPQHHDEMMAMIQAFVHFLSLSFIGTLKKSGADPLELELFSTPLFRMQMAIAKRVLAQSSELYQAIQLDNPYFGAVLDHFEKVIAEMRKEPDTFKERFQDLALYLK